MRVHKVTDEKNPTPNTTRHNLVPISFIKTVDKEDPIICPNVPPAARWRIAISKTNTAAILAPILCSYGFAYGLRNPPGFAWDPKNGRIFLTDIGQNTIEELDTLSADANLGWKTWEGSFRCVDRAVSLDQQRSDPRVTYPIAEYAQADSLLQPQSAASGLYVYTGKRDSATREPRAVVRSPVWRDVLRERGAANQRRPGHHPPHPLQ